MPTRIIQITDLHLLPPGELLMGLDVNERLKEVLRQTVEYTPDAYFLTGDFCAHEPVQEVYHQLRPLLDGLGKPYYISPGNHDSRSMLRNAFFLDGHNDEPVKGLVRVRDRDFLFLDTSAGLLEAVQLSWLRQAIVAYPHADIVMHHPPVPMGIRFMDEKYPLRETGELLEILTADGQRRRVFCGHFHASRTVEHHNLQVHLCPPTSFFIHPNRPDFTQVFLPPGYRLLEWNDAGDFCSAPMYAPDSLSG